LNSLKIKIPLSKIRNRCHWNSCYCNCSSSPSNDEDNCYLPGNFHDSKGSIYETLYWHIESLTDPFAIVADTAFQASGDLERKITKLDENKYGKTKTYEEHALTHLHQSAIWGNNTLTGCFRRLKNHLPTNITMHEQ
jgi:hypothetical protein